jgi:hypothetical protein
MFEKLHFYDEQALLDRLSKGIKKRSQEVVFLVGSPLSSPIPPAVLGVPGVDGVIDLIRREFDDDREELSALETALQSAGPSRYQEAFHFLQGRRGQQTANEIIRGAVCAARTDSLKFVTTASSNQSSLDDECRRLEYDVSNWALTPGIEHLGKLLAAYPDRFGRSLLTTNFDPLIEVAIRRAGGNYFRTPLHGDGSFSHTEGNGCHVVHLHGYWYGADTLHTARQLGQPRPHLKDSLSYLFRNKLVVVCAYGAWDDAFTEALMAVVRDDTAFPEIIWTIYGNSAALPSALSVQLAPGVDRGRVNLYAGIDCHQLFPKLYKLWTEIEPPSEPSAVGRSNPVHVTESVRDEVQNAISTQGRDGVLVLEGDDEDRPPVVHICIGREQELGTLRTQPASVVFITGIGGQGKSTLAAQHFADCQIEERSFSVYVWRDCKEESERFENQIASVVETLSGGTISGSDLAKQDAESIVGLLINLIADRRILFVFDNADHYIDIETGRMIGGPDTFVQALVRSRLRSKAVFTCRPSVTYSHPMILNCHLDGLSLEATKLIFARRGAIADPLELEDAHALTNGHAFWLDLLAIQAARPSPAVRLAQLLAEIRKGEGTLPSTTLSSIWTTLTPNQQTVLRTMAETVKPETEDQIGSYVADKFHYNRFMKALNVLRSLNLVVVKRRPEGPDLLELHPIVRQFVAHSFQPSERRSFIDAIIRVYKQYIGTHKATLTTRPSLSTLEYWTQNVELDISAGRIDDAVATLSEVSSAFECSAYPREYCRTARLLLSAFDWAVEYSKYAHFDMMFLIHAETLSYLGEYSEVDELLDQYAKTIPNKDARYIRYCGLRSFCAWIRGDFRTAVQWGKTGTALKEASDIDMKYDIAHALALAERDAGQPGSALPVFLNGRKLAEVLDPDELDETRGAAHYGNVGRCLHFAGQIDSALVCYQKSSLIMEKRLAQQHVRNQGYIRTWIGELLMARQQYRLAFIFFRAAYIKWAHVSTPKALEAGRLSIDARDRLPNQLTIADEEAEAICLDWIFGRNMDQEYESK